MHGKRVVVVGIGNSGGDIAVEGSRVAEQVGKKYKSTFAVRCMIDTNTFAGTHPQHDIEA